MAEMVSMSSEMNNKKMLVDNTTEGTYYIGLTHYPRPYVSSDKGYRCTCETSLPIWKIKKIVESNGLTETFYPEGNYGESFVRDCRTCYNYV